MNFAEEIEEIWKKTDKKLEEINKLSIICAGTKAIIINSETKEKLTPPISIRKARLLIKNEKMPSL